MPSDVPDDSSEAIIEQIRRHQEEGRWENAAELLAEHAADLLDRLTLETLARLFAPFPSSQIERSPTLWFVAGLVYARLQRVDEAFVWLEKAAEHFDADELAYPDRIIWLYLELARLHYARDEFALAERYVDQAADLMEQGDSLPPSHDAFLHYMIASLCGDTGRIAEGMIHARRAAHHYRLQQNHQREFRSLLTLFSLGHRAGDYAVILDALDQAHACYAVGRLESTSFEALLNAETHFAWYRGDLDEALGRAQTWVRFSQGSGFHRQRLYAHWVMGNVLRALGRYDQAFEYYEQARHIAVEHTPNFSSSRFWRERVVLTF